MELMSPLSALKGVGPAVQKKLAVLGLRTVDDLIKNYPRRYDDYSQVTPIRQLIKPGPVTLQARITSIKGRYVRRGMHITEAVATDDTGSTRLVWFNQPYRETAMKRDADYYISGNFELSHQHFAIQNPSTELVGDFPISTARIIPIYRETKGLNSRQLRQLIKQITPLLQHLPETLPGWLVRDHQLLSRASATTAMHFPADGDQLLAAQRRLGFEEVFGLSLASLMNKRQLAGELAPSVPFEETVAKQFVDHLPFTLTDAQRKVVWQIFQDIQRTQPMNRLVEGDVGSGKTVVATMAAVMVLHHGHQVALMAPTELLARQHAETVRKLLEPLGYADSVGLLVGSMTSAQKTEARARIADGSIRFMVGTNALIQETVDMHNLELVIIDEQHRFGVDQRRALQTKAGHMPHVLSMTATPIPRSLALTLYGELDVSVIADKPVGRLPIQTEIVSPNSKAALNAKLIEQLEAGRQLFVVCPLITDSDVSDLNSAEKIYEQFKASSVFKRWNIGLLHGKLKPTDKTDVMQQFIDKKVNILVSTTVIEVGVDVPNATVMLVEDAERFGLAQLHQLRGRVGRSEHQGYCYLLLSDSKAPSKRLRTLERSNDGFRLAELDLELRGPGAIYGNMQHGALDLRVAKLTDVQLIAEARETAKAFLDKNEDLLQYKELAAEITRLRAVTNLN